MIKKQNRDRQRAHELLCGLSENLEEKVVSLFGPVYEEFDVDEICHVPETWRGVGNMLNFTKGFKY